MKTLMTVLALSVACLSTMTSNSAFANAHKEAPDMKKADKPMSACESQAGEKKLAGAAKNSFVKKCEKDTGGAAKATCDTQAGEKKLAGAAKNSFVKKCVSDAAKA